jgi:hypothetical protein
LQTSNLILDFEFDQHLESHKHVINIIMWFRDMGCYSWFGDASVEASRDFSLNPEGGEFHLMCQVSWNFLRIVLSIVI